ncbi:hypothetical protein AgCh_017741 [Apium graveolens]
MARLQQTQRKRVGSVPRLPVDVVAAIAAEFARKNSSEGARGQECEKKKCYHGSMSAERGQRNDELEKEKQGVGVVTPGGPAAVHGALVETSG